ncbi:DUF4091 domain-containing protein [Luteolibacter arcticus]|uniref:DUF4091 domain-containing protein n=1 Tax=Luteolibacter arcticus TaxID=1581411 RepID=A0ABT3GHF3_9BACT|nr:glycoside hydrolase domain-containing protein [Luteolibacter arcticus]MCW1922745.1 DUF4091 domain-containing protein [Luteolibacter arcticus]
MTKSTLLLTLFSLPGLIPVQAAPARHPSYEPAIVAKAESAQPNLFLKAKVTASGEWSKQTADHAVNGIKQADDHWACENLPVWHQIDLGAPKSISAIRTYPYWGDGRVYQYKVEGSLDGTAWKTLGDKTANSITASPEGDLFSFDPQQVRYVRTTFLKNSKGAANGGHLVEIEGYATQPDTGLTGGFGTVDLRYPPSGKVELSPAASGLKLTAWRGERVSSQIVVSAGSAQEHLHVEPAVLRGPGQLPVTSNFIRYTLADGKPQGDILDTAESLPLAAGTNRPIWLSVQVPVDAKPGLYKGAVTVRSNTGTLAFPLAVEVLPAAIPKPADWKVHLDLWQHPESVARWHDVPAWSPEHFALMKPLMKRLADAGQKTITTTLIHEAWGGQTYDAFPAMVGWTKKKDGTWSYDYSAFDKWVTFMSTDVGMKDARIHCYTMIPWSLKFRYYDEAKQATVDGGLKPGTPEYDEHWGRFLKDFTAHLRAKGWLERTLIGMDERPDALMRGAIATLEKHAPELEIASAINHPSEITRAVQDVSPSIQTSGEFDATSLAARREAGKKTTYYVCTSPPVPNSFTFSPPAESEWLGLFAYAQGFDGLLRWAFNSWVEDPLKSTDFTSWPSGDCFLVYPGNRSSVRFERMRDGMEDFEKLRLLREWAGKSPASAQQAALAKIDTILKDFTWERGRKSGIHAADVQRANAAIEEAVRIITPR